MTTAAERFAQLTEGSAVIITDPIERKELLIIGLLAGDELPLPTSIEGQESQVAIAVRKATGIERETWDKTGKASREPYLDETIAHLMMKQGERNVDLTEALGSPPTPLQLEVWKALDGKALMKTPLAKACHVDEVRLYYMNRKTKAGGLKELMENGLVLNKPGIGYFRLDAPPKNDN